MKPALKSAVEAAYRAFAPYRVDRRLDFAARVSVSRANNELLHEMLATMPLRALPLEAIEEYFEYIAAAHYDGAFRADEFRYFLPRALELIAEGAAAAPWLREHVEQSLERGKARTAWPAAETQALAAFFAALGPPLWQS
jgi:hypothetical protein